MNFLISIKRLNKYIFSFFTLIFSITTLIFLLLSNTTSASSLSKTLNIHPALQEKSHWCWAATVNTITNYINGSAPSQSDIVTYVKGSTINDFGRPSEVSKALSYCGLSSKYIKAPLSFKEVRNQIDAGQPLYVGIEWATGGFHAVIIYGYYAGSSDETSYIYYMDSLTNGITGKTMTYSEFKSNDKFKWYRTFYNIKPL